VRSEDAIERDPVLKRLLGPAGEELTCEECFELLDEYVDLEVAGADADARIPGMGPHFEGCPACGEDHESLRTLVTTTDSDS
jgi:hypothetical protein